MANSNVVRGRGRPVDSGAKKFQFNRKKKTLRQWSAELGISYHTLYARIQKGMNVRYAFTMEKHARNAGKDNTRQSVQSTESQVAA